ncbi:MAG TPA: AAA family ATPase [Fibrobacteraceae bacterium]|nr:AAA family ATPase [Fibrobacteraceae bacterium]
MEDAVVRLISMGLGNFKNVGQGNIKFQTQILGIYGQNGSGKTAVIDALGFLKNILEGKPLPSDAAEFIMKPAEQANCSFQFHIQDASTEYLVDYEFGIQKSTEFGVEIVQERLSEKHGSGNDLTAKSLLFEYLSTNTEELFTPKNRWKSISGQTKSTPIDLGVAKKLVQKERRSFLFSKEFLNVLKPLQEQESCALSVLGALHRFAFTNLFVVRNNCNSPVSLDLILPFNFKHLESEKLSLGCMGISLREPTLVSDKPFQLLGQLLQEMNIVMDKLVPGLSLEIKDHGLQQTPNGEDGHRMELLTSRNGQKIPLCYESEGIKKIISILSILIAVYNKPSTCLVVDELDSGVFEYLLGEILQIMEENGKGTLIFTSHNLRPLEMIRKESLIFTTTNPAERYIRMSGVKTNNNLRDLYLRSINLGGQKEPVYQATNPFELSQAFRKAGTIDNEKD